MNGSDVELQLLMEKLDGLLKNGGNEDKLTSVLHDISCVAAKSTYTVEVLKTLIHFLVAVSSEESNNCKMHLLYAVESIITGSSEKERKSWHFVLNQLLCLFFTMNAKERIHLMLKIYPLLISSVRGVQLPMPASVFFAEMLGNCPKGFNINTTGTEILCVIVNNPAIYAIDAAFVKSADVWRIIRDEIFQPGMICLRVMDSLEHLVAFCTLPDNDFECNVVVDEQTLFSWSKSQFSTASSFWQIYLTLLTSLETSSSAHVIDPFLAKVTHLFSAWSSLNISEYWLELFCQRACNLGNFTVSKRFMHELLQLDFVTTNPRALKFLPKILAAALTEHRFFAIAHSPSSPRHFLKGCSYSEELHPIFIDLCKLFKSVIYSNLDVEIKRDFLLSWFITINQEVYSAPNLSFMLFACSQPLGTHHVEYDGLRIVDNQFILQFRETAFSHMAASESEFKFLFGLSLVRMLISFTDSKSVRLYDVLRFVSNICENLAEKEQWFLMKTLFTGLLNTNKPNCYSFEVEFDNFMRRLMEQSQFDENESATLANLLLLLLDLCKDASLAEKVTSQLADFIGSTLGKVSTNPYVPFHRVMFCVDLIASTAIASPGPFTNWVKQCLASNCDDILLFFANNLTPQTEKSCAHVGKKLALAISAAENLPYDSIIRTISSQLERISGSPNLTCLNLFFISLLSSLKKSIVANYKETLSPLVCRVLETVETKKSSLLNVFQLKNVLPSIDNASLIADFVKIAENADILGTNTNVLLNVFTYCSNNITGEVLKSDVELNAAFCRAVEALFKQVREIVETAEPSWRQVLRGFVSTFLPLLPQVVELTPILTNAVEALYSISQSRHEIWQTILGQIEESGLAPKTCTHEYGNFVVGILSKSLLFGPTGRRLRYFAESYYAMRQLYGEEMNNNAEFERIISQQMVSPSMIRLQAMCVLSSSKPSVSMVHSLIENLSDDCSRLIEKTLEKRPFTNSQTHREKHRSVLAIVFLLGYLRDNKNSDALFEKLWDLCVVKILPKEIFTSVRFLAEWCVVLLLSSDNRTNNFFERLLELYDKAVLQQFYSLICCYIDILSCAPHFLPQNEEKGDRLMKVFDRILPACLFNHFITRARGQAALVRLWNTVDRTLLPGVFDSRFLGQCFKIAGHDQNKPVIKNLNTFIYRLEKPLQDFQSLPLLHFFLPRSCDLFVDEFAFRCDFSSVELKRNGCLSNEATCQGLWQRLEDHFGVDFQPAKPDDIDDLHVVVQENVDPMSGILQRKLTNWRKLLPCYDEETAGGDDVISSLYMNQPRTKPCADLILVASLIDKASNLGGLCRSADVFGLATVTLPSLDSVKNREFESLAVSAHKWLKIIEVPPHQLTIFLLSLQRDGYQLVAAEQATESVQLSKFQFQRKTALILGNEREGIPPHILQLVDTCVEIPQFGFAVRSLNVHVTGALFMYNYSCQHAGNYNNYISE